MYGGSSSTVTVPRRREPIESRRSFRLGTNPRKPSSPAYVREYQHSGSSDCSRKTVASLTAAEAQGESPHPAWPTAQGDTIEDADTSHDVREPYFFSEEAFYPASYAHRPSPTPETCPETIHTAKPKQYHGRGDSRGAYCQGGHNCSTPPSYSVDGRKPAVLCGSHREHGMFRVFHDNRNCGHKGCGRLAQVRYMSKDGKINRFCPKHKNPDVIVVRTRHCEYAGCDSAPLYGVKEGPQNFCREHKRAGMYTNRNGLLLVATRDGSAYRAGASATANSSAKKASARADEVPRAPVQSATAEPPKAGSSPHQEARTSAYSPGKNTPLNRRLCEVPGCMVQPSYGETGTGRPRFCSGHKKKGMVGLKNRPCLFPGCDTRPHYGLSGGRPQFCATHKSDDMIHLLKESLSRVRMRAPRKKKENRSTETEKKDGPAATASMEDKHKASDLKETAGREDDKAADPKETAGGERNNEIKQPEEKLETSVIAKRKRSKRNVVIAATGNEGTAGAARTAGTKGKIDSPKPPALAPPSATSSASPSPGVLASSPPATKGVPYAGAKDAKMSPAAEASPEVTQNQPASRMAEAPGMAPSIEIRLLREARESAKALAAANGSGRRARAPSRKALEASGKMSSEGAQWMTKEKKEELARAKRELKEQRRAAAAAGLKTGHVIEACAVPVAGGAGDEGGGRGSGDRGAGDGSGAIPANPTWRKLSPAEILQAAGHQPATKETNPEGHDKSATTEPKASPKAQDKGVTAKPKAGFSGSKQRGRAVLPVTVEASKEPVKKRKKADSKGESAPASDLNRGKESKRGRKMNEAAGDDNNDHVEQAPNKEVKKRRRRRGKEEAGEGTTAGEAAGSTAMCEFQSCSKPAMYGVNGAVRFCKTHRLPGLPKINGKK